MKLVDVYWGNGINGDAFLRRLYQGLSDRPPTGWSVLQHRSAQELCRHVSDRSADLERLEVVAHGNPYFLGAITLDEVAGFQDALQKVPAACKVYLSGCNTGTFSPDGHGGQDAWNIANRVASIVPCQVFGSRGYLNEFTVADGKVECSHDDWGQYSDCVYQEAVDAKGLDAFSQGRRSVMRGNAGPGPIKKPALNADQRSVIDVLLSKVMKAPPQAVKINPRTGADFTASSQGRRFEFLCGADVVREPATGSTWRIAITPQQVAVLKPLWGFG